MGAKQFSSADIRNICLMGHGSSGKTAIAEAMLFTTGAVGRLGKTEEGTSTFDFEPEEKKRGGSIETSVGWVEHRGKKVNIIDTPGDQNFKYDALNGMRGADAVVIVLSAPDGFEPGAEVAWKAATRLGIPRILMISKMDRDRADPEHVLEDFQATTGVKPVPLQVPIGRESGFEGVASAMSRKAYRYDQSGTVQEVDLSADLQETVEAVWESMVEDVASTDDALMEKYLETFELSETEVKGGLSAAFREGSIVPVVYGAGTKLMGIDKLLDLITWAVPSPVKRGPLLVANGGDEELVTLTEDGPFLGHVIHTVMDESSGKVSLIRIFQGTVPGDHMVRNTSRQLEERLGSTLALQGKERSAIQPVCGDIVGVAKLKETHTGDTLADPESPMVIPGVVYPEPMMALVIHPETKNDEDKLKVALERLLEEDPTLSITHDSLTSQLVLRGMGQAHLEMAIERMSRKYKVNVTTELPPVPYRETIRKRVDHVEGKHKKQSGGAGQFGVAFMNVAPGERNSGLEFVTKIKGGSIPRQFIPSVEKGIVERMKTGFLAGYPIIDLHIELVDGKYHPVDSKDMAFQMAGSKGLRAAFEQGGTVLLEPMYDMEVVVPTENMGDVMGDINGRRGRVLGMDPKGKKTVIKAVVPLAEIQRYAPDLRSMTHGKGTFTLKFHAYEEVSPNMVDKIVHSSPFHRDDEDDH